MKKTIACALTALTLSAATLCVACGGYYRCGNRGCDIGKAEKGK